MNSPESERATTAIESLKSALRGLDSVGPEWVDTEDSQLWQHRVVCWLMILPRRYSDDLQLRGDQHQLGAVAAPCEG